MDVDLRLSQLESELAYLRARQELYDCISRAARGTDRHDEDLVVGAFHPDGVDEHGQVERGMPEFAAALNASHASWTRIHTHSLGTHSCEIEGDEAHAETYVLATLAAAAETHVRFCGARYVDRLTRVDGEWRIARRRVMIDWAAEADASIFHTAEFQARGFPAGTWDRNDDSYQRPLERTTAQRTEDD